MHRTVAAWMCHKRLSLSLTNKTAAIDSSARSDFGRQQQEQHAEARCAPTPPICFAPAKSNCSAKKFRASAVLGSCCAVRPQLIDNAAFGGSSHSDHSLSPLHFKLCFSLLHHSSPKQQSSFSLVFSPRKETAIMCGIFACYA